MGAAGIQCRDLLLRRNAGQIRDALPDNVQFWVAYLYREHLPSAIPSPADSGVSFASDWQFVGDYLSDIRGALVRCGLLIPLPYYRSLDGSVQISK